MCADIEVCFCISSPVTHDDTTGLDQYSSDKLDRGVTPVMDVFRLG